MVVLPDADADAALRAILGAAFGCAGQRCMAGSVLMGVGDAAAVMRDRLRGALEQYVVDDPLVNPATQMGPVIDEQAQSRVLSFIRQGQIEGATLVCGGNGMRRDGFYVRPTLLQAPRPDSRVAQEEIFGPLLTMLHPADLDEAIAWANHSSYGNGAVIFTGNGGAARHFAREVKCGMVGVNVGVPAPMAPFAFSGWNRSFFGDLHVQGMEGVMFYTRQKIVLSRWDATYRRSMGW
jgi:malonate-semialdehyde dehydrogenase (acetylating)/methylmalonate-semialdehyde dehydrogenase